MGSEGNERDDDDEVSHCPAKYLPRSLADKQQATAPRHRLLVPLEIGRAREILGTR